MPFAPQPTSPELPHLQSHTLASPPPPNALLVTATPRLLGLPLGVLAAALAAAWWLGATAPTTPPQHPAAQGPHLRPAPGRQLRAAHQHTSMAATGTSTSTNTHPICVQRPLVVLFGDSLTQHSFDPDGGWGAALANHYQRKVDVVNRGLSGYNSRWGRVLLDTVLQQAAGRRVELLTIWFGPNDCALPDRSAQRQHVPVQEFSANLAAMVEAARQAGNVGAIVLITPPPIADGARVRHQQSKMGISTPVPPDRTLQYTQQYADAVVELGGQLGLPVVDLYRCLQQVPGWQTALLTDGLHFTPAGSRAVWDALRSVLEASLPHLSPDAMPHQFPWHDQLDAADFQAYWAAKQRELQTAPCE